jgi:hypothetical protein
MSYHDSAGQNHRIGQLFENMAGKERRWRILNNE